MAVFFYAYLYDLKKERMNVMIVQCPKGKNSRFWIKLMCVDE